MKMLISVIMKPAIRKIENKTYYLRIVIFTKHLDFPYVTISYKFLNWGKNVH